ncbi:RNA-directed RNA polymerase [ssRNA phage Gerhypos.1_10]|uniref:RNA-directed RNA polymerase n=2 Tax=Leviviricetes TaxID=2842243 RepID=A0A8S5L2S0_9VIRU|nr:RNA-directed RNA polymerase [ssRNA phage Gerhypos.1_10]QDH89751.1 MAG: RNA-dependent RNA polymerase [Leviviridae sp.]DAD52110.1 TPA_asm: RNA-directed RNA polymerase [ssRNA phage Gerhypos.1_10]
MLKSLTSLWSCTAQEMAVRCCTSAALDIKTVERRFKHEGLSFLAITLADFGKAIQKWLDQGFVVPSDAPSFARGSGRLTGLPVFLQGFLGRVFEPCSGALLENPDIEAIYALRQLTLMFSKIALPESSRNGKALQVVTPERERRAMLGYLQCEQEVKESDVRLDPQFLADFKRMSDLLFGGVFAKADRDVYWARLTPKHGPGAVADRLSSNAKWNLRTWTTRLQRILPAEEFLVSNSGEQPELNQELDLLEPGSEIPVRVITVPKTLKTPRIIAIEPTAMMYAQQAILRSLLSAISEDGFLSRVVGFDDQEPNRFLARLGSLSGDLATLDLSEASDRVSNQHVLAMLDGYPHLLEAVQAARSRKADVPGHGVIRLAKFASMGSALCFPFEAMVFLTIIFLGIERELSAPLPRKDLIKIFSKQVRVFGDDLIVPRDYVLSVVDELHTFGYVVNVSKSYWTGRFRESCGREYYDGHDVSIVKVRQILPTRRQDANGVISAVSLRNQLYWAGLWKTAGFMDDYLRDLLKEFPNVAPTSPLLGRESVLGYQFDGLDPYMHSPLTKGYYVHAKPPPDFLEGSGALLKCLLRLGSEAPQFGLPNQDLRPAQFDVANVDDEHLERSGRPEAVNIKLGRRSPF